MDLKEFGKQHFGADNYDEKEQKVRDAAKRFEGMSEDQLFSELMSNVQAAKNGGNFNYNEILSFANNVFPFLNEQQQSKLVELLKFLANE